MELLHKSTTDIILASFYNVYNTLGYGFLEKVYENALFLELTEAGLVCEKQKPIEVFYKDIPVGNYFADIVVNGQIIIELKAAEGIVEEHEFQLLNYLRATEMEIGLLLNFGKKPQFKRKLYRNKSVLNQ
jgi:GxxExxY protein